MPQSELDSLQATLNVAIDTVRDELSRGGYPELSSLAIEPHPLDNASHLPSRKLFEAQTTAVGVSLFTPTLLFSYTSLSSPAVLV